MIALLTHCSAQQQPLLEWNAEWEPRRHQKYDSGAHGREQCGTRVLVNADGSRAWFRYRVR
jgi:hypothetical protein